MPPPAPSSTLFATLAVAYGFALVGAHRFPDGYRIELIERG
jgi:hypothetical protein